MGDSAEDDKDHELENEWVFWFDESPGRGATQQQFEQSLKQLGSFQTIQEFWHYFDCLQDFSDLPDRCNIRMFKKGVKPTWESPENVNGGKWVVPTQRDLTQEVWTEILLSVIGEQLENCDDLCGVVLSLRPRGDTINVWNQNGQDVDIITSVTEQIKSQEILVQKQLIVSYNLHQGSMDYNRNLQQRNATLQKKMNAQQTPEVEEKVVDADGFQVVNKRKKNKRAYQKLSFEKDRRRNNLTPTTKYEWSGLPNNANNNGVRRHIGSFNAFHAKGLTPANPSTPAATPGAGAGAGAASGLPPPASVPSGPSPAAVVETGSGKYEGPAWSSKASGIAVIKGASIEDAEKEVKKEDNDGPSNTAPNFDLVFPELGDAPDQNSRRSTNTPKWSDMEDSPSTSAMADLWLDPPPTSTSPHHTRPASPNHKDTEDTEATVRSSRGSDRDQGYRDQGHSDRAGRPHRNNGEWQESGRGRERNTTRRNEGAASRPSGPSDSADDWRRAPRAKATPRSWNTQGTQAGNPVFGTKKKEGRDGEVTAPAPAPTPKKIVIQASKVDVGWASHGAKVKARLDEKAKEEDAKMKEEEAKRKIEEDKRKAEKAKRDAAEALIKKQKQDKLEAQRQADLANPPLPSSFVPAKSSANKHQGGKKGAKGSKSKEKTKPTASAPSASLDYAAAAAAAAAAKPVEVAPVKKVRSARPQVRAKAPVTKTPPVSNVESTTEAKSNQAPGQDSTAEVGKKKKKKGKSAQAKTANSKVGEDNKSGGEDDEGWEVVGVAGGDDKAKVEEVEVAKPAAKLAGKGVINIADNPYLALGESADGGGKARKSKKAQQMVNRMKMMSESKQKEIEKKKEVARRNAEEMKERARQENLASRSSLLMKISVVVLFILFLLLAVVFL